MTEQTASQGTPPIPLALLAQQIDAMLAAAVEQYEQLRLTQPQSWVLDDYSVGRVISKFTVQRDELWRFDEQLRRWGAVELTDVGREEVTRLNAQMLLLNQTIDNILRLTADLSLGAKEEQLPKSNAAARGAHPSSSARRKRSS